VANMRGGFAIENGRVRVIRRGGIRGCAGVILPLMFVMPAFPPNDRIREDVTTRLKRTHGNREGPQVQHYRGRSSGAIHHVAKASPESGGFTRSRSNLMR